MPPYGRSAGWLSRGDLAAGGDDDGSSMSEFPDDALSPVFARLPAADVVRCAATCRRWCCVVAKDAAVLSRGLPTPLPRLALGFFRQPNAGATARKRKRSVLPALPTFVPTATGARLLGSSNPSTLADAMPDDDGLRLLLEHAIPVAARNGYLVLELRRDRYTDPLRLCVCNPMTGHVALLPPLEEHPGDFACALLTGHDLDPPAPLSAFFRLLLVYNRRSFTALRSYSRDTDSWSAEARRSGPKVSNRYLRTLGQSTVFRGVAYWHRVHTAFAVRMDVPQPAEQPMPPHGLVDGWPDSTIYCMASDGKLMWISTLLSSSDGSLSLSLFKMVFYPDDDTRTTGKWERAGNIRLKQLKVRFEVRYGREIVAPYREIIKLRWFCEKSGVLFFTLGPGTHRPGAFALNLATEELEKLVDGLECHAWTNLVGYEMDGAAYLASMLHNNPS